MKKDLSRYFFSVNMMQSVFASSLLAFLSTVLAENTIFTVDFGKSPSKVWKFWESGTTEDHGYLALRYDFREQLEQVHRDLNIQYVRLNNMFSDDLGIINPSKPSLPYSYINIDKIYDWVTSIGMKPLVNMDFIPSSLASKDQTIGMYEYPSYAGPPLNYTQWYYFVQSFTQHLSDRYTPEVVSQWIFDAWNEPNGCCWTDKNLTTFEWTWNQTARAVKSVNKSFLVGAPGSVDMGWIYGDESHSFVKWCLKNNVPLDFVSAHMYPTKSLAPKTHNGYFQIIQNLSTTIKALDENMGIALSAYGCTIEDEPNPGPHDTSYNAACFSTFASQFQALNSSQFWIMSFTGFTDLWDQNGVWSAMFHDGYGWLTNRGIKKPTYQALQLLVNYASDRNYYKVYRNNSNEVDTTLEVFVTVNDNKNQIAIFVMNWMLQGHSIKNETVQIDLVNLDKIYNGKLPDNGIVYRIDDDHCNPLKKWKDIGSPMYPTQKELDMVGNASVLVKEEIKLSTMSNGIGVELDVMPYGMAVVVIDL
eukprot:472203_1